ncbi:hypothetical protein EV421DRAFT_1948083 [Armillaria borealis]|uniref:Uncharacterized protein n=1 Tax=Armillaria borealis TaxID=47425 RepID=A0AA39JL07_9AGAR|nr:hypothetical protein EV421DRAFT_1948083 [Armillaria borealis]
MNMFFMRTSVEKVSRGDITNSNFSLHDYSDHPKASTPRKLNAFLINRSMSLNFSPIPTAQAEKLKSDVSAYPDLLPAHPSRAAVWTESHSLWFFQVSSIIHRLAPGNSDGHGDGKAFFAMLVKTRYSHTPRYAYNQVVQGAGCRHDLEKPGYCTMNRDNSSNECSRKMVSANLCDPATHLPSKIAEARTEGAHNFRLPRTFSTVGTPQILSTMCRKPQKYTEETRTERTKIRTRYTTWYGIWVTGENVEIKIMASACARQMYPLHIVSAEEYGRSHKLYPPFHVARIFGPGANLWHQHSSPSPYPRICIPFPYQAGPTVSSLCYGWQVCRLYVNELEPFQKLDDDGFSDIFFLRHRFYGKLWRTSN